MVNRRANNNEYIAKRALRVGSYILNTHNSIRKTSKIFGVSKSTVKEDINRLKELNPEIYSSLTPILQNNFAEKHIRGGLATKRLYALKELIAK